ncbi:hypothetical protein FMM05_17545 [Flavobacterium zepuense]|uniref:Uncharacterized protein n=1 Tax=Flavobacterium zepuense TaxID=2593302 RepID=A0A552UVW7_9FLAO|nr:hypothetical protein [Flavobacterium zepuense]TRW22310.1 hypothetical protein FMM05_17545 [Flavobacterium zepuense]
MSNYKLSVPKPCHESWDAMTPDAKGRYCGLCEKTVVDFTGMPGTEISSYLLANAGKKVCGRFNTEQLDPKPFIPQIPRSVLFSQTSFRKMFLLALLVTMGTTLFSCRRTIGEPAIVDDTEQQVETINQPDTPSTKKITVAKGASSTKKSAKDTILFQLSKGTIVGEVAPPPPEPTQLTGDTIVAPK